jgi:spore maturation protein CgeB
MKILFSGYHNPHFDTVTEYVERAIRALGHDLVIFNDADFLFPGRIRGAFRPLADFDLRRLNRELGRLNKLHKPDLCLVEGGYRILPETVSEIKGMGISTALWMMDAPHDVDPILRAAPEYQFCFCAGTEHQELLARHGIKDSHWLPFACDPGFNCPKTLSAEETGFFGSPISFVGSYYPNRMKILEGIADLDLKVWGPGWDKVPDSSPLSKCIKRAGNIKPEDWVRIFCSSGINLVIHFQDSLIPCNQASPKVYEVLACKSFMICDNQKDVNALFEDGKHMVIFKDVADLREKIGYYLGCEEDRNRMANQGFNEVITKHTYVIRLKQMLDIIRGKV